MASTASSTCSDSARLIAGPHLPPLRGADNQVPHQFVAIGNRSRHVDSLIERRHGRGLIDRGKTRPFGTQHAAQALAILGPSGDGFGLAEKRECLGGRCGRRQHRQRRHLAGRIAVTSRKGQ
jgi:hypothetical protein